MANPNYDDVHALSRKTIILAGTVSIAANASVSSQAFKAGVVAKTGTGAYTLTLDDSYQGLLGAHVQTAETAAALFGRVGAASVTSAKTIVLQTVNAAGAATDAAATLKLYVTLVLSNSSVN